MNTKMKYVIDPKEIRTYKKDDSCIFKKNNEEFGGLSNMATKYPLVVNNIPIKTSEALYQACRFPHLPEIQKKIIEESSPMTVKMISNANKKKSRSDWENVRIKVMKWCLHVKLAQNFVSFGALLHKTGLKNIVENSSSDNFWGAIPNEDGTIYTGKNALGRLLMDLRQVFYSKDNYWLLYVEPPEIDDFLLYENKISVIDERPNFINWLKSYLQLSQSNDSSSLSNLDNNSANIELVPLAEKRIKKANINHTENQKPRKTNTSSSSVQTDLFYPE